MIFLLLTNEDTVFTWLAVVIAMHIITKICKKETTRRMINEEFGIPEKWTNVVRNLQESWWPFLAKQSGV